MENEQTWQRYDEISDKWMLKHDGERVVPFDLESRVVTYFFDGNTHNLTINPPGCITTVVRRTFGMVRAVPGDVIPPPCTWHSIVINNHTTIVNTTVQPLNSSSVPIGPALTINFPYTHNFSNSYNQPLLRTATTNIASDITNVRFIRVTTVINATTRVSDFPFDRDVTIKRGPFRFHGFFTNAEYYYGDVGESPFNAGFNWGMFSRSRIEAIIE